jgi:hypothetical protein
MTVEMRHRHESGWDKKIGLPYNAVQSALGRGQRARGRLIVASTCSMGTTSSQCTTVTITGKRLKTETA